MTHRVHPNECLPVLGIADVNQPIQFSRTDAVCNKLNIRQRINYTSFLCTQDHSTEISIHDVGTETSELRYQLHTTREQQYALRLLHKNSIGSISTSSLHSTMITAVSVHKIVTLQRIRGVTIMRYINLHFTLLYFTVQTNKLTINQQRHYHQAMLTTPSFKLVIEPD